MELISITNHLEIMENKEIATLVMKSMTDPTPGKFRSLAEAGYANYRNLFYVAKEGEKVIGILGVTKIDHGGCKILNFAIEDDLQFPVTGKAMLDLLMLVKPNLEKIEAEVDASILNDYKSIGFKSVRNTKEQGLDFGSSKFKLFYFK